MSIDCTHQECRDMYECRLILTGPNYTGQARYPLPVLPLQHYTPICEEWFELFMLYLDLQYGRAELARVHVNKA
jgi:hypothetical protein